MQKQLLKKLLIAALVAGGAGRGYSQAVLQILQPASIAGQVTNIAAPTGTGWGFGDVNNVPAVTGECVYVSEDSATCVGTIRSLTGKIAVIYRNPVGTTPTCFVAPKILRLQQAGAIGAILIARDDVPVSNTAVAPEGALVTIPFVSVGRSFAQQNLLPLIKLGGVIARLGSVNGLYPNNLTLFADTAVVPPSAAVPGLLISQAGDFAFTPFVQSKSLGNQPSTGVVLRARVLRDNGTVLYKDSATVASIAPVGQAGSSLGQDFRPFDLVTAVPNVADRPGKYKLIYDISSAQVDSVPANNRIEFPFQVTDRFYSKARLVDAGRSRDQASISRFISGAGGGSFSLAHSLITRATAGTVGWISFAATTNRGDDMAGLSISAEVDEWLDANNDSTITDDELAVLGSGSFDYSDSSQRDSIKNVPIYDAVDSRHGVVLSPSKKYFIVISYQGTTSLFLGYDATAQYATSLFSLGSNEIFSPIRTTRWFSAGFTGGGTVAARTEVYPDRAVLLLEHPDILIAAKSLATLTQLRVIPSPTSGLSRIEVSRNLGGDKVDVLIHDAAGRVVYQHQAALAGQGTLPLDVRHLGPGLYNLTVRGSSVALATRFVVK